MSMIINFLRRILGIDRSKNDNRREAPEFRVFVSSYAGSKVDNAGYSKGFCPSRYRLSQSNIPIEIRPKFDRPLRDSIKKSKSLCESLVSAHTAGQSASIKISESLSKSVPTTRATGQWTSIEKLKSSSQVVGQLASIKKSEPDRPSRASEPSSKFVATTQAVSPSASIKKSESDRPSRPPEPSSTHAVGQLASIKKSESDGHSRASEPSSKFVAKTQTVGQLASIKKSESDGPSRASEPSSKFVATTQAVGPSAPIKKSESDMPSRASEPSSKFVATTQTVGQLASIKKSESNGPSRASEPSSKFVATTQTVGQLASIKKSESDGPSRASEPSSKFVPTTQAVGSSASIKKLKCDRPSRASESSSKFIVTTHTVGHWIPKLAMPLPEVTAEPPPTSNPTLRPVSGHGRNQSAYMLDANSSLPLYLIPKDVEELIKKDVVPPVLRNPVSPLTYKSYFAALLYAEDFYCKKWSDYELVNVNLELREITIHNRGNRKTRFNGDETFTKTFAAFEFDSVPDRRPFLLSRDLVYARLSGTMFEPFQGFVYRVAKNNTSRKGSVMWVDFGKDFYSWHRETNKYDISFTFNRVCLKRAHKAIEDASDSLFQNFLFPESNSRKSYPKIQVTHSIHQLDPDQKNVVHRILSFHSSPPYLIAGPPCILINRRGENRTFSLSRMGTTVKEAVIQIYSTSPNRRILICATTNTTCDELMISLKKVIPESNMFRATAAFRERDEVPDDILSLCDYNEDEECFTCPTLDKLEKYKIIFSTFMSSFQLHAKGLAAGHFDHIFLLDASAAIEPVTLVPLTKFATNATCVVVTGQPGGQPSWIRSTIARTNGLKTSYFQRLEESLPYRDLNPLFISELESEEQAGRQWPSSIGLNSVKVGTYMC